MTHGQRPLSWQAWLRLHKNICTMQHCNKCSLMKLHCHHFLGTFRAVTSWVWKTFGRLSNFNSPKQSRVKAASDLPPREAAENWILSTIQLFNSVDYCSTGNNGKYHIFNTCVTFVRIIYGFYELLNRTNAAACVTYIRPRHYLWSIFSTIYCNRLVLLFNNINGTVAGSKWSRLIMGNWQYWKAYGASTETKQTVSKAGATLKTVWRRCWRKPKVYIKYKQVKDAESFLPSRTYKEGNVWAL